MTDPTPDMPTVAQVAAVAESSPAAPRWLQALLRGMSMWWDWFDQRDVEKHLVTMFTLWLTYRSFTWGMHYAEINAGKPGLDVGAVISAIGIPIAGFQTAVLSFYFKSRTTQ